MTSLNDFLKERGIIIKFMNEELLNSHLRISLGTQEQNKLAIEGIKEFMNQDSNWWAGFKSTNHHLN